MLMPPVPDAVRKTVDAYVRAVAHGTVDDILALYADGATVEDPVGTEVRKTEASIREFYAVLERSSRPPNCSRAGSRPTPPRSTSGW